MNKENSCTTHTSLNTQTNILQLLKPRIHASLSNKISVLGNYHSLWRIVQEARGSRDRTFIGRIDVLKRSEGVWGAVKGHRPSS